MGGPPSAAAGARCRSVATVATVAGGPFSILADQENLLHLLHSGPREPWNTRVGGSAGASSQREDPRKTPQDPLPMRGSPPGSSPVHPATFLQGFRHLAEVSSCVSRMSPIRPPFLFRRERDRHGTANARSRAPQAGLDARCFGLLDGKVETQNRTTSQLPGGDGRVARLLTLAMLWTGTPETERGAPVSSDRPRHGRIEPSWRSSTARAVERGELPHYRDIQNAIRFDCRTLGKAVGLSQQQPP
jgi:hypothetical protein